MLIIILIVKVLKINYFFEAKKANIKNLKEVKLR